MHLCCEHGVRVQVGGSDQWGNTMAGTDLIRRLLGGGEREAPACFGLTFPLLLRGRGWPLLQLVGAASPARPPGLCLSQHPAPGTPACTARRHPRPPSPSPLHLPFTRHTRQVDSEGRKFGESTGGAIWLSAAKLSPYKVYKYLFATADADVVKFLCMLTFLRLEEVAAVEAAMQAEGYVPNTAQRRLTEEVTRWAARLVWARARRAPSGPPGARRKGWVWAAGREGALSHSGTTARSLQAQASLPAGHRHQHRCQIDGKIV
jgi:hypothetical protein